MKLKINPRQAHGEGSTHVAYSLTGDFLFSVGGNGLIRKFSNDDSRPSEPETLDNHNDAVLGIACSQTRFASCSEDGTVNLFDLKTSDLVGLAVRNPLAIREVRFSPDGKWLAVCGDDRYVKITKAKNILKTVEISLRTPAKHISYDTTGKVLAVSCLDGVIRFYQLNPSVDNDDDDDDDGVQTFVFNDSHDSTPPLNVELIHSLDGIVPDVKHAGDDKSTFVAWHPDGIHFAVATKTFEIAIYSRENWLEQKRFRHDQLSHKNAITSLEWSPNGKYLLSAGLDGKVLVWESKSLSVLDKYEMDNPLSCVWHPQANEISISNERGEIITLEEVLEADKEMPFGQPVPFLMLLNGNHRPTAINNKGRYGRDDDYDLDKEFMSRRLHQEDDDVNHDGESDWIVDDDGAGYVEDGIASKDNRRRSRTVSAIPGIESSLSKRSKYSNGHYFAIPDPFISGSTPWKNGRKYLCMNMFGYIWTVAQDSHNTITVTFFDKGLHREFHFTDYIKYDLACLGAEACLFASTTSRNVFLRFHDGFSDNWEYTVSDGDSVRSISLSDSVVVICTSKGYVRTFNIYGTPRSVYRQSRDTVVTCASWQQYLFIVRARSDGSLSYSLEDTKSTDIYQKDDALDIGAETQLIAVFFSDRGDPCIFDSSGVLLVLYRWRDPLQARWVPMLDSKAVAKSQGRSETYWPIGIIDNSKFLCTILKGDSKYPPLPLPVTAELDISIPVDPTTSEYEQELLTKRAILALSRQEGDVTVSSQELDVDKVILRLIQVSCKDARLAKAISLAGMIHKDQALEAASKVAVRFDQTHVAEKINDLLSSRRRKRDIK